MKTLDEVVDVFVRETNDPEVDSVEGIMYSLNEGTFITYNRWPLAVGRWPLACSGSVAVEQSSQDPKLEGSNLAAADTRGENNGGEDILLSVGLAG